MKYKECTFGLAEAVFNKLGGMEGVHRFLRGELEVVEKKKVPVSNIALAKAYAALLGMESEYEEALQRFKFTQDPNLWEIIMVKGLTCRKLVQAYKKARIQMCLYAGENGLDNEVTDNQRDPNRDGNYLVSFRRNMEADEENKNQSADQRRQQECQDITLAERLLLGLAYFLATGKHLDQENVTQCAGSRGSDGAVPYVGWSPNFRRVCVVWYYPGNVHDFLRARSVVSLTAEPSEAQA